LSWIGSAAELKPATVNMPVTSMDIYFIFSLPSSG
jgi:hypothetical protein